ncbi:MAG: antibiotic biosynthesis monooxygenase family protein [Thermodesulfobacteriota bacterium]|nr:antibiotic biosynthesis monooxygenase family protein [Thermodesulfobacteriota bacterium]
MAIKVLITRKVNENKQKDLLPLLIQLRKKAMQQNGYISGETLRGINDPTEFLVISSWKSIEAWKVWEKDIERKEIQEKIDTILEQKTTFMVYTY